MPDHRDDFEPSDIPNDVVIQEALAPFLGGFGQAETAARAAYVALVVTYRRVIVDAEELAAQEDELRRLRAAVSVSPDIPSSRHPDRTPSPPAATTGPHRNAPTPTSNHRNDTQQEANRG